MQKTNLRTYLSWACVTCPLFSSAVFRFIFGIKENSNDTTWPHVCFYLREIVVFCLDIFTAVDRKLHKGLRTLIHNYANTILTLGIKIRQLGSLFLVENISNLDVA